MLSASLLLPGCGRELERTGTEVMEQTYQVDPAARLSISNLKGSISIRGADTTELQFRATKTTEKVAQLNDINISVAAEAGSISISTSILPQKRSPVGGTGSVDYVLVVPRTVHIVRLELEEGKVLIEGMEGEDVRANVVDGQVILRNCCGDIHVAIANGDLDLSYQDCAPQRSFVADAQLTLGDARILLPPAASVRVRAATVTGKLANDFADMVEINGRPTQKIDMLVGPNARSQLNVRVTTGDIRIAAVERELAAGPPDTASTASD
jgi:hypothetical protein